MWFVKTLLVAGSVSCLLAAKDLFKCPGNDVFCPSGNSCCQSINGEYGCCPFPKAICCSDNQHCCPEGFKCNVTNRTCVKTDKEIPAGKPLPSKPVTNEIAFKIMCPGGEQQCDNKQTCCFDNVTKRYRCCNYSNALCCPFSPLCCPQGFSCKPYSESCFPLQKQVVPLRRIQVMRPEKAGKLVICDRKHACRNGSTCCKNNDNKWMCCPHPQAVCCSDNLHCCPIHTKCVRQGLKCKRGNYLFSSATLLPINPLLQTQTSKSENIRFLQKPVNVENSVVFCPDVQTACPNGSTCCKQSSGQWGCCPLPQAVCCSDGIHCCPSGYTCDVSSGTCSTGSEKIPLLRKQPAKPVNVKSSRIICPDGYHEFPDGYTCCKRTSGVWGCCPHPKAVCCSDKIHCCPNGYTCNVPAGTCVKGAVVCPDGHECPTGNTCCERSSGGYGCCPLPEAVCCSDKIHCCPNGYTCDVSEGACFKGSEKIPFFRKQSTKPLKVKSGVVVCPGGQSACPNGNTCCKLSSGLYGCCPLPQAVCCSDGIHCCPSGYKCDVSAGTCSNGSEKIPLLRKQLAKQMKVKSSVVVCPNGQSECPNGDTCCKLSSGGYGCCPLPEAVCCSDGIHCCPSGYKCDVSAGTCSNGSEKIPLLRKQLAKQMKVKSSVVVCPNGQSECPNGDTCCKLSSGGYGCCPLPEAVCCSDGIHCCPSGYRCDLSAGRCIKGSEKIPFLLRQSTKQLKVKSEVVVCPGGQFACPDGNTCCKLSSGQWGCCPLPQAVCCSDHIHCCPSGYTCDVSVCSKGSEKIRLLRKQPAKPVSVKSTVVICPDGQSKCPDRNTCCKLSSGQWGCCPLPQAVCCSDHIHCCPSGYTCDVSVCSKGSEKIRLLRKQPAKPVSVKSTVVICPDGQSKCPDRNTCCKLSSGQWGCCPLPQAVCCSDHIHCCPSGYTCDVSVCSKGSEKIRLLRKQPTKPVKVKSSVVFCPDGHECPNGDTCCKLPSGQYGCCPLPQAVCCSDGLHCCPSGYTCNVPAGTCSKGSEKIRFLRKQPTKQLKVTSGFVVCPDGQSHCHDGNTCCKLSSGQWGCCPLPQAVCCSDGVHCCPSGYTCDVSGCSKGSEKIRLLRKQPAKPVNVKSSVVVCPGEQSECPTGFTCCKLSSGQWGCCPLPQAVCCSDGIHCCPSGYRCDLSAGTCKKGSEKIRLSRKQPTKQLKLKNGVICPGGQSECPTGFTCCKLSSGQWGCCPLPEAVCCSDGIHCCPSGYRCDLSAGTCNKGSEKIRLSRKQPTKQLKLKNEVICPRGQSECPNGNTCCKLSSGQWGCCPLPEAVCCSDGIHCCPSGYRCDLSAGTCSRGSEKIHLPLKQPTELLKVKNGVLCPGGQSECPTGFTCCKLSSGQWGCCPLPEAVCCSDGIHCCPSGYTCDVSACNKGSEKIRLLRKQPAKPVKVKSSVVVCPDGEECPNRYTCCRLSSGLYGCCPLFEAVCCSDGIHCCPSGYRCDLSAGKCSKGSEKIRLLRKQPAKSLPRAVCCGDHTHCCPAGYRCDLSRQLCVSSDKTRPMLRKISSLREVRGPVVRPSVALRSRITKVQKSEAALNLGLREKEGRSSEEHPEEALRANVIFSPTDAGVLKTSDHLVTCEENPCVPHHTCCPTPSGKGHCCPLPRASCCADGRHCCPQGFACSEKTKKCERNYLFMPLIRRRP